MACFTPNARNTTASLMCKVLDGADFVHFQDANYIHVPTPEGLNPTILESLPFHGQNVIAQLWAPSARRLNSLVLVTTYQPAVIYGDNEELQSYHQAFLQQKYYINPVNRVAFGLPGRVFLTCKPEQTQDVHCYPEDHRPRGQYDFFNEKWGSFCVPVILNGRCEGVLEFVTDNVKDSYDNDISVVCTALEDAGLQTSTQIESPEVTEIDPWTYSRERDSTVLTKYSCLVPYLGLSSDVAAERLGKIGEGTFRLICRRVGIPEWLCIKNTTIPDIAVVRTALENAGLQTSTQVEPPKVTKKIRKKSFRKRKSTYFTGCTAHGTQIHQISSSETSSTAQGSEGTQINQISSGETCSFGTADVSDDIFSHSEFIENTNPDFVDEKTTIVRVSAPDTAENIFNLSELIEIIASPSETQDYHIALDEDWMERELERSDFMLEFNDDLIDQSNEAPELMGDIDPVEIVFNSNKWENDQVQRFDPIPFPC